MHLWDLKFHFQMRERRTDGIILIIHKARSRRRGRRTPQHQNTVSQRHFCSSFMNLLSLSTCSWWVSVCCVSGCMPKWRGRRIEPWRGFSWRLLWCSSSWAWWCLQCQWWAWSDPSGTTRPCCTWWEWKRKRRRGHVVCLLHSSFPCFAQCELSTELQNQSVMLINGTVSHLQAKGRIKHLSLVAKQICIFVLSCETWLTQPSYSNELQPAGTGHTGWQIIHVKPEKYVFSSSRV